MEKDLYLCELFDYYKELLTDKQKQIFMDYYFDNLTLQEISENNLVSRNAIHKQLKDVINKLEEYEKKLGLKEKSLKIEKLIKDLDEKLKDEIKELI